MRKFSVLMIVALIASALAACATPTAQETQVVEVNKAASSLKADLVMWTSPMTGSDEKPLYQELIKRFQVEYPDINVKVEWVPWSDRDAKFSAALAAGTTPDVAYVFVEGILGWVKDGVLAPLDGSISQPNWDDVLPLWQKAVSDDISSGAGVDKKLWMLPYLANGMNLMYNKDLLTQAGVEKAPVTWDDMMATCEKVKALGADYYCFPLMGKTGYNQWMSFWWQAGGNMFSDDFKTLRIGDDAGLAAMQYMNTLNQKGYMPKESILADSEGLEQMWQEGKLAFKDLWAASAPSIKAPFTVVYQPTLMGKQAKSFAAYGGWGMFSNSKQKDAASAWLNFLANPESVTFWLQWVAAHGTQFQGVTKTTATLITSSNQLFSDMVADQAVNGAVHQLTPGYMTYTDALGSQVEEMLLNNKDPKKALEDAVKAIEELQAND